MTFVAAVKASRLVLYAAPITLMETATSTILDTTIAALHGIGQFIGFLECVPHQAACILGEIPGAAGLRVAQATHEFAQIRNVVA